MLSWALQWAADMPEWWVQQTRDWAASRGRWQWDWYIVPAGMLQSTYGEGEQWADGVGAVRVTLLPSAPIGNKVVAGELWFIGGKEAYEQLQWEGVDMGSKWAQGVVVEWVGDLQGLAGRAAVTFAFRPQPS